MDVTGPIKLNKKKKKKKEKEEREKRAITSVRTM
jgi:hypothetical protein